MITSPQHQHLSSIELSASAVQHNISVLRKLLPTTALLSLVIKGNAYGHGQSDITSIITSEPFSASELADHIAYVQIDDMDELRRIRTQTDHPALVLGYIPNHQLEEAINLNATLALYNSDQLHRLNSIGEQRESPIQVHLKVDALLGRMGVLPEQVSSICQRSVELPFVEITGIYSHFSNIEDTKDLSHAQAQLTVYQQAVADTTAAGCTNLLTHISATSGILTLPQAATLGRLGIGLYGMWPSIELQQQFSTSLTLRPVLRWVSHLAAVKKLPANHPIGYGLSYITPQAMTVAVIPQGYSDGYDRGLSNQGEVLVHGQRCPVVGRVAMNMMVIDVSQLIAKGIDVAVEEEVVLLGTQTGLAGSDTITAEELAAKLDTINYEVTTRISPLLPRMIVD